MVLAKVVKLVKKPGQWLNRVSGNRIRRFGEMVPVVSSGLVVSAVGLGAVYWVASFMGVL